MNIIGQYRYSSVIASTSVSSSAGLFNISSWKPSGLTDGAIIGTGLYVWSGSYSSGYWIPLEVGMLK